MLNLSGALLEGHFKLLSGKHSHVFLKFRQIAQQANNGYIAKIGKQLASYFNPSDIDVILGPVSSGGLIVDKMVEPLNARAAFVELARDHRPSQVLLRGFHIDPEDRVLVVNDMTTTGTGLRNLMAAAQNAGGKVVGIALFAVRHKTVLDQIRHDFDLDNIHYLVEILAKDLPPVDCPGCKTDEPLQYSADLCE
jgi:orotate phosphoribosyltransferase